MPTEEFPYSDLIALWGANVDLPPIVLLHVGHRWYDPALGRFVQRDPISLAGGSNLYAYLKNQPTIAADPSGLVSVMPGLKPKRDPWSRRGGGGMWEWAESIRDVLGDAVIEALGVVGDWAGEAAGGGGSGGVCVFWTVKAGLEVVGNIGPIIGYAWARNAAIGGDWVEYERRRRLVIGYVVPERPHPRWAP